MRSRAIRVMLGFYLSAMCLLSTACGMKSSTFIGAHGMGTQKVFGAVAQSAVEPIDQFLKTWLARWENGACDSCYTDLADSIRSDVSLERLNETALDMNSRFGPPQRVTSLDQPVAAIFPRMDEALLERSTEAALKYYSYVITTYLSHRPTKNLVYAFAVGMKDGHLSILGFATYEQVQSLKEKPAKVHGFGIPL